MIVDGAAEVTKGGKRLATRKGGEFFGEIALITTTKRTATVTATTELRCFILTRGDFRRVLDENPGVQRKVMEALGERLLSYSESADLTAGRAPSTAQTEDTTQERWLAFATRNAERGAGKE